MIVDCDRCEVRGLACQDCVITVLLGAPPSGVELDGTERLALDPLAEAGMVPHLQLVDRDGDRHMTEGIPVFGVTCAMTLSGPQLTVNGQDDTLADRPSRTSRGSRRRLSCPAAALPHTSLAGGDNVGDLS